MKTEISDRKMCTFRQLTLTNWPGLYIYIYIYIYTNFKLIEQTVKRFDACEGSLGENERKFALYSELLTELLKASL